MIGDDRLTTELTLSQDCSLSLDAIPTAPVSGCEELFSEEELQDMSKSIQKYHEMLIASREYGVLLLLQGKDAAGKDGTTKHLARNLNPVGTEITSFKVPTEEEREHDFLWRVHQRVPGRGMVGIHNRSHYEDVLVPMVEGTISGEVFSQRCQQINDFERMLYENGIFPVKIFLHISKDEQKNRLEKRLTKPKKQWKFSLADLTAREQWEDFTDVYEQAMTATSTDYAPWHIIPADHKPYRNALLSQLLLATFTGLGLRFPKQRMSLKDIVIED